MGNTFLQLLGKLRKRAVPNFENLSKKELIAYIKTHCDYKQQAISFVRDVNIAAQESYFEGSIGKNKREKFSFEILEGVVTYHPKSGIYTFEPGKPLSSLIKSADSKNQTRLKEILNSRLYKIIESTYRIDCENAIDKNLEEENIKLHQQIKELKNIINNRRI